MTSDLNVRPGIRGSHTGGAGRWKNFAAQFAESPCQGAMEVILRVSVATGKVRASATKHRGDISYRYTPLQQLFGDPFRQVGMKGFLLFRIEVWSVLAGHLFRE